MTQLKLDVFSRRKGSIITIAFTYKDSGWHISDDARECDCEQDGEPYLIQSLRKEETSSPLQLNRFISHIWDCLHFEHIDEKKAQVMMNDIAEWITACEKNTPKWQGYNL